MRRLCARRQCCQSANRVNRYRSLNADPSGRRASLTTLALIPTIRSRIKTASARRRVGRVWVDDAGGNYETDACEIQTAGCVRLSRWSDRMADMVAPLQARWKRLARGFVTCFRKSHKCEWDFSDRFICRFECWAAKPGVLGLLV